MSGGRNNWRLIRLNNLSLILDTGNFLFDAVVRGYKKGQGFKRGGKSNSEFRIQNAELIRFGLVVPDYTGYDVAMLQNFMVECFTVSGVMNYDLQEKLKKVASDLAKNPEVKNPKEEWLKTAQQIIPEYAKGHEPPRGELKTNFRTAMTSAYQAGLWDKTHAAGIYRYLQYKTRKDARVRDWHKKLDDKIFHIDDPIWKRIYPPNGWNCRCYVRPMTHDEMKDTGYPAAPMTEAGSQEEKQILKDANVEKEFNRNAALTKSIWGKWLDAKVKEIDLNEVSLRIFKAALPEGVYKREKDSSVDNEVWGEMVAGEVYSSKITRIRYGVDGFYVNDGERAIPYEQIDKWRRGVIMNYEL